MALGLYFTPSSFTPASYDEAVSRLEAAGAGSQESFEALGATLVPIMTELGADPGQPMISPVHNIIKG
jgi:hypothetical protein